MSQSSTLQNLSLENVSDNFSHWRAQRTNKKEKTPSELIDQALSLTGGYPVSVIIKTLGLSYSMFKKEGIRRGILAPVKPPAPAFLEVSSSVPAADSPV